MKIRLFAFTAFLLTILCSNVNLANAQTDVVAFWHFNDEPDPPGGYDFREAVTDQDDLGTPGRFSLNADLNNTVDPMAGAVVEVFLGNAGNLDGNGGGGFSYISPVSGGLSVGETRTIKFDDLRGGGDDFDIGGNALFTIDTGDGPVAGEDFGNDALLYFTLDGTGFQDFELRFDTEGTPFNDEPDDPAVPEPFLPSGFDIFYRTTGPDGTWFRESDQNNIPLITNGRPPTDEDNQDLFIDANADGVINLDANGTPNEYVSLASALDNASSIEIIITDFEEDGDGELEIDNIEIVANAIAIPEPTSTGLIALAFLGLASRRRR